MTTDVSFVEKLTRRDFLKTSGLAVLTISGGLTFNTLLNGCAHTGTKEEVPIIYPPLKRHKVQPPEHGCYIGFSGAAADAEYYESLIGIKPAILVPGPSEMRNTRRFPKESVDKIVSAGAIPFIWRDLTIDISRHGFSNLVGNREFKEVNEEYAKAIVKTQEPLFVCTMHELNLSIWPWGQQHKIAKKTWRYMWQIFEDTGANDYATWVWQVYCPSALKMGLMYDVPERYYPGDQYVDWIGLSAYSRKVVGGGSLAQLIGKTYRQMRRNHPQKPVLQSEFGKTRDSTQPRWIQQAYRTIKKSSGIKAAIIWDYTLWEPVRDNHSLSPQSFEILEEIFKDPYFIGAG